MAGVIGAQSRGVDHCAITMQRAVRRYMSIDIVIDLMMLVHMHTMSAASNLAAAPRRDTTRGLAVSIEHTCNVSSHAHDVGRATNRGCHDF